MPSTQLAYLFRAYFTDGTTFDQTLEDVATLDHPRKGTGSSVTDLLWLLETGQKDLAIFALRKPRARKMLAAVHLDTGHFELTGNEFYAGDDGLDPGVARRLVYYRLVTRHRTADVNTFTGAIGEWVEAVETRFVIGWQATVAGRNVQHVIGLDG